MQAAFTRVPSRHQQPIGGFWLDKPDWFFLEGVRMFFVKLDRVGNQLLWLDIIYPEEGNWLRRIKQLSFGGYDIPIFHKFYTPDLLPALQKAAKENHLVVQEYKDLDELVKGLRETLRVLLS